MVTFVCPCDVVCLEANRPFDDEHDLPLRELRHGRRAVDARSPVAPIVDAAGGTSVVLWRKDRVRCLGRSEQLVAHRLGRNRHRAG